jgi:ring-1,2-phenylacetyl-CoA epoxidase subunit PaaC
MSSITPSASPLVQYLLRRADDALILGHRLSEWVGHAPMMEEDMALGNMGLDLIGQARSLYAYAANVEGAGRTEDDFAYLRRERDYRNVLLVEQPNGDFAETMLRQFFYAAFADPYWLAMRGSSDATLAAIAAKSEKEMAYHLRHSAEWVVRLGDSTPEARRRVEAAIARFWPFTGELFTVDGTDQAMIDAAVAIDPATIRSEWDRTIAEVFVRATLSVPTSTWMQTGGRSGQHGEHFGHLLSELQYMQRAVPGAVW